MLLPDNFVFNQNNLQDYVDCNRRFYYREILHLEWPAVESEPIREQEELMELGTRFHLLCQQYLNGVPVDLLLDQIDHSELLTWWQNFLDLNLMAANAAKYVEKLFTIPFANYRLAAKVDLLLSYPDGELSIFDWKTSQHKPQLKYVLSRMQAKVYPFLLAKLKDTVDPDKIQMTFWYPAFPDSPIRINYSSSKFKEDQYDLQNLIAEISKKTKSDFKMTDETKKCAFCRFRSLCERGIIAGESEDPTEIEGSDIFDLDFGAL